MDWTKPTSQLLGRFQPWHQGHTELFKRAHAIHGQCVILVRKTPLDENNPLDVVKVMDNIVEALTTEGFTLDEDYIIMVVPNITDISYGRDVGYSITQHDLGEDVHKISATEIRKQMRARGEI
jgi:hypothetical protein